MIRLNEKFLLEYFRKHYSQFKVSASFIDWQTDDGMTAILPQMKSDVTIEYNGMSMIIDANYYGNPNKVKGCFYTPKRMMPSLQTKSMK